MIEFTRAAAGSEDVLLVSAVHEKADPFDPDTKIYRYDHRLGADGWFFDDLSIDVQSMTLFQPDADTRYFCCLSSEGQVYHNAAFGPFMETIEGAGVAHGGRLYRLAAIGPDLVACGENGQVFLRTEAGSWEALAGAGSGKAKEMGLSFENAPAPTDPGFFEWVQSMANPFKSSVSLFAATGTGPDDLYVAGVNGNATGIMRYRSADGFEDVSIPQAGSISGLTQSPNGIIWACGRGGTLLVGERKRALQDRSTGNKLTQFTSLAWYEGACWIASVSQPRGLFRCEQGGRPERVTDGPRDVHSVCAVGDVLWVVGQKVINRLQYGQWEKVAHPDLL